MLPSALHLGLLKQVSLWISSTACGHRLLGNSSQWLARGRALVHLADDAVARGVLVVSVPQGRALHNGEGLDEVRYQMDHIDAIGDEHSVSHAKVASVTGARLGSVDPSGTVFPPHIAVVGYGFQPLQTGDEHHMPLAHDVSALAAKCGSLDAIGAGLVFSACDRASRCWRSALLCALTPPTISPVGLLPMTIGSARSSQALTRPSLTSKVFRRSSVPCGSRTSLASLLTMR